MPYEFKLTRRIEFAETDMAGIVHFANFFRMMEATEHAFFRSLGFTIHGHDEGGTTGWPRVSASCDFRAVDSLSVRFSQSRRWHRSRARRDGGGLRDGGQGNREAGAGADSRAHPRADHGGSERIARAENDCEMSSRPKSFDHGFHG